MSEAQANKELDETITATWERVPSTHELQSLIGRLATHAGLEEIELELDNAA